MIKLNRKNILIFTLIIAIIAISMSVALISFNINNKTNYYGNSTQSNISSTAVDLVGRNGNVETNYVSPYRWYDGVYPINDANSFNNFLNAAKTATEDNKVYGYLTSSFTYNEAVKGTIFKYAYLDGCGKTITLSHDDNSENENNPDPFDKYEVWKSNAELPHYSGSTYETPFGQVQGDSFYTSGYLAGFAIHSVIKNLNIIRTGYWNYYYYEKSGQIRKGKLCRPYAIGTLFGYMWDCNIDNCSLDMQNYFYFFMQGENNGGDYNSVSNLCMGGYTGVFDGKPAENSEIEASISNSSVNLNKAYKDGKERPIIEGLSAGNSTTAVFASLQRNSARAFVGGMVGVLCNLAKMYNLTVTGTGNILAIGHGPTWDSGGDRICFSGAICGSNYTDDGLHLYTTHTDGARAASNGTIDGVISTWTGFASRDVGTSRNTALGITQAEFVYQTGTICGFSTAGNTKNIYFNMTYETMLNAVTNNVNNYKTNFADEDKTKNGPVEFLTVGPSTNSGNYIDLAPQNTLDNFDNAMYLYFDDLTANANINVAYDITQYTGYNSNSGMFVWDFKYSKKNSNGTYQNMGTYQLYKLVDNMQDALDYKSVTLNSLVNEFNSGLDSYKIKRDNENIQVKIEGTYGHVVKYKLDDSDNFEVNYGSKTYNGESGLTTTPTINLYTHNGSSIVQFKPLTYSPYYVNMTQNGLTYYTNSDIWTVYETGSNITQDLNYIKNATNYTMIVYNGVNNTSNIDYRYDFLDINNKIVSYKQDNTYYQNSNTKWQPRYTYTINPKVVTGDWQAINNTIDNINYTAPQDITYYSKAIAFKYQIPSAQFIGSDTSEVSMSYFRLTYTPIARADVDNDTEYYALVDGNYIYKGKPTDVNFGDYDTYYTQSATATDQMKNVGYYKVVINDINSVNYTLNSSLNKEYYFKINPRQVNIDYNDLYSITYTGEERKATYAVSNRTKTTTLVSYPEGLDYSDANIQIWNVLDETAIVVTYTTGNDYIHVGTYTIEISLASGVMASNYLLPTKSQLKTDFDNSYKLIAESDLQSGVEYFKREFGEYTSLGTIDSVSFETGLGDYYYDDGCYHTEFITNNDKITKVIRTVEILNVRLKLAVEYNGGKYESNINHRQYEELSVIETNNSEYFNSHYSNTKIYYDGEEKNVYKTGDTYSGYNSLILALVGVPIGNGIYDHVYTEIIYYPATYNEALARYEVVPSASSVYICEKTGVYIACISFRTQTYKNYGIETFYMVYEVEKMVASITIDGTGLNDKQVEFSSNNNISIYEESGEISGINRVDSKRGVKVVYKCYRQDDEYNQADKIVIGTKTYAPIDNLINAGNYIIIVDSNLAEKGLLDNYQLSYNDTNCTYHYNSAPYFKLEVIPQEIHITVEATSKTYTETFDGDIAFEIVSGELLEEGASIVVTSLGFAASASVGNYDITANVMGDVFGNYIVVVDNGTNQFTVDKIELNYDLGTLTKVYSTTFDTSSITPTLVSGTILMGDNIILYYSSDGFADDALVDNYSITITLDTASSINYRAVTNTKLAVTKKLLTIDNISTSGSLEYDGNEKVVNVTFIGVKTGDTVNGSIVFNNNSELKAKSVGMYNVLVVGVDNNNYSIEPQTESTFSFEITKREVTINIDSFTMGYADISLTPLGNGYTYEIGSNEFIDGDEINLVFTTLDQDTMLEGCGTYNSVVTASIIGSDADNYDLIINQRGDLTITAKDITTMTLKNNSTTFTGNDLSSAIEFATSATDGYTYIIKKNGEVVDSMLGAGDYQIEVTGDDELFVGTVELTFTVEKAQVTEDMISSNNVVVHYNKLVYTNNISNEMSIGLTSNNLTVSNEVTNLKAMTRYTIYVQFAESDNYLASEIFELNITTSYNPNLINDALNALNENFGFDSITKYEEVLLDINKVSAADESAINTQTLNDVNQKYDNLINGAKEAILGAQGVVAKATSTNLRTAAMSVSLGGVIVIGLCAGLIKKKKQKDSK